MKTHWTLQSGGHIWIFCQPKKEAIYDVYPKVTDMLDQLPIK